MDLFRSIQMKLAQRELGATSDGPSVDLRGQEAAPAEPPIELSEDPRAEPPEHWHDDEQDAQPAPASDMGLVLRERYEIVSRLGEGRYGSVYKALDRLRSEHPDVDCHVAIKIPNQEARSQPEVLSQLRREFYSAQKLSHPSVVKVFELDRDQDLTFYTMELIEGEVIGDVLQRFHRRALPRPYVFAMLREVGEGLAHAHERRVIHGDLSPRSIMVTNAGELRILGFGAAGKSATAMMPAYASCEVLEGREPDQRDDLFALACLSYELLSGEHPFQQRTATEARSFNVIPPRPAGLSSRQWNALTLGLAWERENRTQSVRDWLVELNPGAEHLGPIPLPQDVKPARRPMRQATPSRLVAILAALIISMVSWVVLHQPAAKTDEIEDTVVDAQTAASTANIDALISQITDTPSPADDAPALIKEVKKTKPAAPVDKTERIGIAAGTYKIAPGEKFAEIQVRRTISSSAGTSFEWWTEAASAVEGVDYVPQSHATMSFPRGKQTASLFIKLLPNQARKRTNIFYVVIGNPSGGSALGNVAKAKVALPPASGAGQVLAKARSAATNGG